VEPETTLTKSEPGCGAASFNAKKKKKKKKKNFFFFLLQR